MKKTFSGKNIIEMTPGDLSRLFVTGAWFICQLVDQGITLLTPLDSAERNLFFMQLLTISIGKLMVSGPRQKMLDMALSTSAMIYD